MFTQCITETELSYNDVLTPVCHVKVTNDIFTKEDGEFLVKNGALPPERIRAVETGGCPHAAIREDISINLGPLEELSHLFSAEILLCESGGGNNQKVHHWKFLFQDEEYISRKKYVSSLLPLND